MEAPVVTYLPGPNLSRIFYDYHDEAFVKVMWPTL